MQLYFAKRRMPGANNMVWGSVDCASTISELEPAIHRALSDPFNKGWEYGIFAGMSLEAPMVAGPFTAGEET